MAGFAGIKEADIYSVLFLFTCACVEGSVHVYEKEKVSERFVSLFVDICDR